jgi:hypothetical protein
MGVLEAEFAVRDAGSRVCHYTAIAIATASQAALPCGKAALPYHSAVYVSCLIFTQVLFFQSVMLRLHLPTQWLDSHDIAATGSWFAVNLATRLRKQAFS